MTNMDIAICKWGVVFLKSPGLLSYSDDGIKILNDKSEEVLNCKIDEIKSTGYNSINGMITLKTKKRKDCNFVLKGSDAEIDAFTQFLDRHNIKDFSI